MTETAPPRKETPTASATTTEDSSKHGATSSTTVFVGMSGGVDSSVAALLLQEQGYRVVGVYMKNWSQDLPGMRCPWAEDLADAKRVAVRLGIDFLVWDFEETYREKVVEYMLAEFRAGRTPNPDVMCNQEIKFKLFYEKAREAGADFIATGHYARVVDALEPSFSDGRPHAKSFSQRFAQSSPRPQTTRLGWGNVDKNDMGSGGKLSEKEGSNAPLLLRSVDENKDQTYFLYRISEEALAHTVFPIGGMRKPEVKKLAAERGLHNAYKKESMGVCFVGEVGMREFLGQYLEVQPGEIREAESERVLGWHEGAVFYTLGQRHGLYLSGVAGEVNDGLPYYVVKKDLEHNIIYVSKNLNHTGLWTKELRLTDVVWRGAGADEPEEEFSGDGPLAPHGADTLPGSRHASPRPSSGARPRPKGRSLRGSSLNSALVAADSLEPGTCPPLSPQSFPLLVRLRHRAPLVPARFDGAVLRFESEVKRPADGQSAVLYDGEICLGGGIITS